MPNDLHSADTEVSHNMRPHFFILIMTCLVLTNMRNRANSILW